MKNSIDIEKQLNNLTIKKALYYIQNGELNIEDLLSTYLTQINKDKSSSNPINAVTQVYENSIEKIKSKKNELIKKQLKGIPILIKDNMNYKGQKLQCASSILKGYEAIYTAGAIEYLENNGGFIFGVTNMDEFAMGSSNETSIYGCVRNPLNKEYTPGGSSGGAAASVSANMTLAAIGSDTGGSIRQPASLCGLVGLKPTYGLVSRFGLVAFGSSLDQIGPITKNS